MRSILKLQKSQLNIICLIISSLLLLSCGGKTTTSSTSDQDITPLSCVVVLQTQTPYKEKSRGADNIEDLQAGVDFLDKNILSELKDSKVTRIIETSQIRPMVEEVYGGKLGALRELGEKAGCNGILITTLSQFRERQGGELAVDSPASAAFEIQLVEADSGHSLCMSTFNETQSSLLENVFSFSKAKSRGFKWITVRELASQGLKETLRVCPYLY